MFFFFYLTPKALRCGDDSISEAGMGAWRLHGGPGILS